LASETNYTQATWRELLQVSCYIQVHTPYIGHVTSAVAGHLIWTEPRILNIWPVTMFSVYNLIYLTPHPVYMMLLAPHILYMWHVINTNEHHLIWYYTWRSPYIQG